MSPLRRLLAANADWLAVTSLVLWFATVALVISGFIYGQFPDGWTLAAAATYVLGIASGTFARMSLADENRRIATAALALYVACSAFGVFLLVLPKGFEGG